MDVLSTLMVRQPEIFLFIILGRRTIGMGRDGRESYSFQATAHRSIDRPLVFCLNTLLSIISWKDYHCDTIEAAHEHDIWIFRS